jgi:SAM-dependent methyltransferase
MKQIGRQQTKYKCRACGSTDLTQTLHSPKQSLVDINIVACVKCNLVQGLCDEVAYSMQNDSFKDPGLSLSRISCDSPYSNIRVGKQQMADKFFRMSHELPIDYKKVKSVLDVRSARGSFILNSPVLFANSTSFIGFEQDLYLHPPKSSINDPRIKLYDKSVYNTPESLGKFDFIYSCHSLEHYREPVKYIQSIESLLSDNGLFFVDVPNLFDFVDCGTLDDFFYDKHLLYFIPRTLVNLLVSQGFAVKWLKADGNGCIECLAERMTSHASHNLTIDRYRELDPSKVIEYSKRLDSNRSRLPFLSRRMEDFASSIESPLVAFGAGRILDAFVCYGGLDTSIFRFFVDNYLSQASAEVNGNDLLPLCEIKEKRAEFILFTRNKSSSLVELILSQCPLASVYHWSDF